MSAKQLTILLLCHLFDASINHFIKIGQILRNRGHRIVFVYGDICKGIAAKHGFEENLFPTKYKSRKEFYSINTDMMKNNDYFSSSLTPLEKIKVRHISTSDAFIYLTKNMDAHMKHVIYSLKPNVIILDHLFVVLPSVIKSGCPWAVFGIANPLQLIDDLRTPPFNSGLPANDQSEWNHFREEYYQIISTNINAFNKWLIDEGLSQLPSNLLLYESKHLNFYHYPEEIDYCDLRPLSKKWIRFDAFVRSENQDFVIPEHLNEKPGKLILFSMGTFVSANIELLMRIIDILAQTPHRYIISKGIYGDRYELSDNMWGENMIPQVKVLPLVDMVITHGGNNSIIEAFYFGKPMIVMPLCNDQYSNAQRVAEKGFGVTLDPNLCTKTKLTDAIENVLNDEEICMRMKVISRRIQNEEKSDKFVQLIEDLDNNRFSAL